MHTICMRCCGFGGPGWEGGRKTWAPMWGSAMNPATCQYFSRERTHFDLSLLPPSFCPCQDLLTHLALRVGQKRSPSLRFKREGSLTHSATYTNVFTFLTRMCKFKCPCTHIHYFKKKKKFQSHLAVAQNLNLELPPSDPAISLLGIDPRERISHAHTIMYMNMDSNMIPNSQTVDMIQMPIN